MSSSKVKPIPEGFHSLIPSLTVSDANKAIDFYKKAFGAQEIMRMPSPDGKHLWHGHIKIGDSHLFMADEAASMGIKSPLALGGTPVALQLNVENCDEVFNRAVAAGAKADMQPTDMFWGDRYGAVTDPFGFRWALATHVKDLTPEEMKKASEEAARQFAQQQK